MIRRDTESIQLDSSEGSESNTRFSVDSSTKVQTFYYRLDHKDEVVLNIKKSSRDDESDLWPI